MAQEAARVGASGRWVKKEEHEAEALRLVSSQPFYTWSAAAAFVCERIDKDGEHGTGRMYAVPTVIGWLKKAGWKPQPKVPA